MLRQAVHDEIPFFISFFLLLNLLPLMDYIFRCGCCSVSKDVGMTPCHFIKAERHHASDIELSIFLCNLTLKNNMEEEVCQFFLEFIRVSGIYCIYDLVSLFYEMRF